MPYKDLEMRKKYQVEYRKRPSTKKKHRNYNNYICKIWRNDIKLASGARLDRTFVKESEEYAEKIALPQLGFQNVTKMFKTFSFDFICDLNGQVCLVDVTMVRRRDLKKKTCIALRLRLPFYVLFVRPDKSVYYLKEVKGDRRTVGIPNPIVRSLELIAKELKENETCFLSYL